MTIFSPSPGWRDGDSWGLTCEAGGKMLPCSPEGNPGERSPAAANSDCVRLLTPARHPGDCWSPSPAGALLFQVHGGKISSPSVRRHHPQCLHPLEPKANGTHQAANTAGRQTKHNSWAESLGQGDAAHSLYSQHKGSVRRPTDLLSGAHLQLLPAPNLRQPWKESQQHSHLANELGLNGGPRGGKTPAKPAGHAAPWGSYRWQRRLALTAGSGC